MPWTVGEDGEEGAADIQAHKQAIRADERAILPGGRIAQEPLWSALALGDKGLTAGQTGSHM